MGFRLILVNFNKNYDGISKLLKAHFLINCMVENIPGLVSVILQE